MSKMLPFLQKNGLSLTAFLFVLPFFLLTFYAHPLGFHDWDWAAGFIEEVSPDLSFLELQSYFYLNTMGRYASTAFTSTLQYWFSPDNFKIFLSLFFISFLAGIYFFTLQLFKGFLSRQAILSVFAGIICIYFAQLSSPYEAFYNISCIGTYNLGGLIFMVFVGLLCKKLKAKTNEKSPFSDVLLFLTGILAVGSNEVTLLATNLLLFLLLVGNFYYHEKWNRFIISLFLVVLVFSCAAVFAPGNFARMDYSDGSGEIFKSIFLTISLSAFGWLRWLSVTPIFLFGILYLPLGLQMSKNENVQKFFNYPLFAGFGVLVLQPTCLFLLFYSAGGSTFPERYTDLIFLVTLLGLLYFLQSCIVLAVEKKLLSSDFKIPSFLKIVIAVAAILSLFFADLQVNKSDNSSAEMSYSDLIKTSSNSSNAWLSLLFGKASTYDKDMKKVYLEIDKCVEKTCYINPPTVFPPLIYDKIYDRKALKGGRYIIDFFHGNRNRTERVRYRKEFSLPKE